MPTLNRKNRGSSRFPLVNPPEPELFRDIFPYTKVNRTEFDDVFIMPRPAKQMVITDTTFRDGQQARPPYTVEQVGRIFDFLHHLGGKSGLIRQSEFFLYSEKDRKALEVCRAKDYKFPQITGWIRCHKDDLKLVRDMELEETGLLTSVSDYHVYLKLGKDREQAMHDYLAVVEQALEWGIRPRCHFEDITRADIYGFCIPFARKLMELSQQSGIPVKIRLCDTMGYGVPYPGAALPRSVPRVVRALIDGAGVPGEQLEWHGHNDFHKVVVNAATAWLNGCSAVNGTLLGFGERTGNAPIEAMVMEYIQLTGDDDAANTRVISEIADYFENELDYRIPQNYPFVGKDFNATSAGVHVDGLIKNEEIYNIFDTSLLLNRPVPIIITDKSGRAGVSYWINQTLRLVGTDVVSKKHPAVGRIYNRIMDAYERGRTTSFSDKEMMQLVKRYMPELFPSEFDNLRKLAHDLAAHLVRRLVADCDIMGPEQRNAGYPCLERFVEKYDFIQFMYVTNLEGRLVSDAIADPEDMAKFERLRAGTDFSEREWFLAPLRSGELHITDFYQSCVTGRLCLTVSVPITDEDDEIVGVLGADMRLQELMRLRSQLEDEERGEDSLV